MFRRRRWMQLATVAQGKAQHIGEAFRIATPGAVSDGASVHRGLWAEDRPEGSKQRRTRRRDQLLLHMGRVGWHAAQQVSRSRGRNRKSAVRTFDHAAAYIQRRSMPHERSMLSIACSQILNTCARGNDIDDGIDRADFMEVNLFDWDIVNLCFRRTEQLERVDGAMAYGMRQGRILNQFANL
jgi:hypothetical protein